MNDFNEDKFPGLRKHRNMYYLHATACVGKHKLCTLSLFASVERLYSFATILDLPQYGSLSDKSFEARTILRENVGDV